MVKFFAFFVLASSLTVIASPFNKRTVAQVEADIATINTDVNSLNTAINGFPATGGTLAEALAIHTDATNLETAITKGTTDVQNTGAVSEADGTTILKSVQAIQPTIISALNGIVAKKAAFQALPLGGVPALVKADLNTLNTDTSAFEAALIAAAPADLVANATAIKTAIDAAFSNAIAAYADA